MIDRENAAGVIFDMKWVKVLPDGSIDKSSRNDPTKQADALDTVRYYCNTFHGNFLKAHDSLVDNAERAAVPAIDIAKQKAIAAIKAGLDIVCTAEHYHQGVRALILSQFQIWLQEKNIAFADRVIKELTRLDLLFPIKK